MRNINYKDEQKIKFCLFCGSILLMISFYYIKNMSCGQRAVNVGIIGCGQRAWGYVKRFDALEHLHLVAVCDTDGNRSRFFASEVDRIYKLKVKSYTDTQSLIDNEDVDIMFICTPDHSHLHVFKQICNDIKNIVIEKPMCISMNECKELDCIKQEQKVNVFVPFVLRFSNIFRRMNELLPKIGNITRFDYKLDLNNKHSASYYRRWHRKRKNCGSFLLTKGCHDIDVILWMNGAGFNDVKMMGNVRVFNPRNRTQCSSCDDDCKFRFAGGYVFMTDKDIEDCHRFDACIFNNDHDIMDHFSCMVNYNDYICTYSSTMYQENGNRQILINGTKGYISCDYMASTVTLKVGNKAKEVFVIESKSSTGHKGCDQAFLENMLKAFRKNEDLFYQESLSCIRLCELLEESR